MTRLEHIGTAAAGIAHDINNQLMLILNHLDSSDLDAAKSAAGRCCALTASLLAYTRGETLRRRPLNLSGFVQTEYTSRPLPPLIAISLDTPAVPEVNADPAALERILWNLVSNACDAMENTGTLHIRVSPWCIEVEDSGPGIPAEHLSRIFEPFFTTKGSAGTGLGLAIVRDLMRQHGGSVAVDSQPGRGTRIQLRFRNDRRHELCK